jgi:hypothetical protein
MDLHGDQIVVVRELEWHYIYYHVATSQSVEWDVAIPLIFSVDQCLHGRGDDEKNFGDWR